MSSQRYAKKRPCGICRRWFMPHPRLKDRQQTCGDPVCKKEWHRKKCAEWNKRNGDYFRAKRLPLKQDIAKSRFRRALTRSFANIQ